MEGRNAAFVAPMQPRYQGTMRRHEEHPRGSDTLTDGSGNSPVPHKVLCPANVLQRIGGLVQSRGLGRVVSDRGSDQSGFQGTGAAAMST